MPLIDNLTRPKAFGKERKKWAKIKNQPYCMTPFPDDYNNLWFLPWLSYEITKDPIKARKTQRKWILGWALSQAG